MSLTPNYPLIELPVKNRIPSIDYFRTIAVFAVILAHTDPFSGAYINFINFSNSSLLKAIVNLICAQAITIAIPFFLVIAGYFYGRNILSSNLPAKILIKYLMKLITAWLFWGLLYLLIPNPLNLKAVYEYGYFSYLGAMYNLMTADFYGFMGINPEHLWFLPALIISLCTITLFYLIKAERLLLPLGGLSYLFLLFVRTPYQTTHLGSEVNKFLLLIDAPSFMKFVSRINLGFYCALIFVYIGWYLATKKTTLNIKNARYFIYLGVAIYSLEILVLGEQFGISQSYCIGTIPLVSGLTMYILSKSQLGQNSMLSKFGRYAFGIYLIHVFFFVWLKPIEDLIEKPFSDIILPFATYSVSLIAVVLISKIKWFRYITV